MDDSQAANSMGQVALTSAKVWPSHSPKPHSMMPASTSMLAPV